MTPTPDLKKKLLKQIGEITAVLLEHGLESRLSDVGPEMIEFTVKTNRPLTAVVKSLYMRDGVERVLVNTWIGRSTESRIQVCLASWN